MRKALTASILGILLASILSRTDASVAPRTVEPASTFNVGILNVERFGNPRGRSIVLIPALFCGSWEWNAQIAALSRDWDIYAVTLPGFNGRRMVAGDNLMARGAASLHQLIVSHRLRRPVIAGHSLGGTLTVYLAEHYQRDASSVVTVEGGYPIARTQAQRDARVAGSVAPYRGIAPSKVGAVIEKTTLQYTITNPHDVAAVEKLAGRSDPAAIVAWMRAALSLDLTPALSAVTVPFTVIIPFDPTIDPYQGFKTEQQKRSAYIHWAAHARNPEVIVIAPSRHFVMFDEPERFEKAFETAIAR